MCRPIKLLLLATTTVSALKFLPEHARSGRAVLLSPELVPPAGLGTSEHHTLAVPLDHFGSNDTTFDLNYFTDPSVWDPAAGPIFMEMGGEGPCGGAGVGTMHKEHKALAVAIEHRFYGASIPFNDRSLEMLQYLSIEQALADHAAVVEHIQSGLANRRVVINFGGSYSGATAAFFREKYPNVTHAASSSSGVVNAILNFTGFDEQVELAIEKPVPGCAAKLKAVTAAFEAKFAAGEASKAAAKVAMGAGNLVGSELGDNDFWYMIADGAAMADQYGHKKELCTALELPYKNGKSPSADEIIIEFSAFIKGFWGKTFSSGCFYDSECLKNNSKLDMSRSWRWQKCTELAYLQPGYSGSLRHEGLTLGDLIEQCKYVFGDVIAPDLNTARTNMFFGGATIAGSQPQKASRIIFTDYSDDPWARASVQSELGPDLPFCLTTCDGCGHCGAGVPANLTRCKDMEASYVSKWLLEAKAEIEMTAME
jgi:hypothetical protein